MSPFFFPPQTGGDGSPSNRPNGLNQRNIAVALVAMLLAAGMAAYMMYEVPQPPPTPASCPAPAPAPASETAVVVHSYTGRTATVGREIASMLGASFHEFNAPPLPDGAPASFSASRLAELSGQIRLQSTRTLYFGFPIWGEGPTHAASAFINSADLTGKKVVLFYTYLHFAAGEEIGKLAQKIRKAGAECPEPVAIRLSVWDDEDSIVKKTRLAILARRDLWGDETTVGEPVADCGAKADGPGSPVCTVPAGKVWASRPRGDGLVSSGSKMTLSQVAEFKMDRKEATVGEYLKCADEGACKKIDLDKGYCAKFLNGDVGLPMPCATPADAGSFCKWAGKRLPTLEEWTRAARGDSTRAFPWGDDFAFSGKLGNFGEKPATGLEGYSLVPADATFATDKYKGLAPGCSFPAGASPFGLCDMAGNLAEIVTVTNREVGENAAIIGGSWLDAEPGAFAIDSAVRWPKEQGSYFIGFRCVK